MGLAKNAQIKREEERRRIAERDERICPYCREVILYETVEGPNGECPVCVRALKKDD